MLCLEVIPLFGREISEPCPLPTAREVTAFAISRGGDLISTQIMLKSSLNFRPAAPDFLRTECVDPISVDQRQI